MSTAKSKDGTSIAYEAIGQGPAVILVDGALGFRAFGSAPEVAKLLAPAFTVYTYDRRGRGESGATGPVTSDHETVAREVEDIEALIDAAGGSAYVYGISSGGALALEAAIGLPGKVTKLAVYEIPYDESEAGMAAWRTYRAQLAESLAAGRRGDAVEHFMRLVGASDDGVAGMRQSPVWPTFEAVAPTLAYDAADLGADRTVPVARAATVTAPALVMDGGASLELMPFMRATAESLAAAMPHAQRQTLEGQSHQVDSTVLAPALAAFFKA